MKLGRTPEGVVAVNLVTCTELMNQYPVRGTMDSSKLSIDMGTRSGHSFGRLFTPDILHKSKQYPLISTQGSLPACLKDNLCVQH
jgi:hypothetical protein